MATTIQPDEQTQEFIRLLYQNKKNNPILSYYDLADESVKSVFNTFVRYEPSHENSSFSISDAKDVTAYFINVSAASQNPRYHDDQTNQEHVYEDS